MKRLFWISLFLPLAVVAEELDYFNESIEHVAGPHDIAVPPATPAKTESKQVWGQGILAQLNKLTTHSAAPKALVAPLSPEYLQRELKAKEQEIARVRQQIMHTTNGRDLQSLTGALQRLEAEHQRILQELKTMASSTSSMAAPTPAVEQIPLQDPSALPVDVTEEDALKIQVERLKKEEAALFDQIKTTTDSNTLSTLSSQLERTQQNKSMADISLKEVQRRNIETSKGFGAILLPPAGMAMPMEPASLTPSLAQVAPPALPTPRPAPHPTGTQNAPSHAMPMFMMPPMAPAPAVAAPAAPLATSPWPTGWGKLIPDSTKPSAPEPTVSKATGTPVTGNDWNQLHDESTAHFGSKKHKDVHANYSAPQKPLWTPAEPLTTPRKSVTPHAPINHRHIIEKIRGEKIFSN